jgi:hypothetical protein
VSPPVTKWRCRQIIFLFIYLFMYSRWNFLLDCIAVIVFCLFVMQQFVTWQYPTWLLLLF